MPHEFVISLYVKHHEIAQYIGLADFAITPVKPVPSKRFCSPIKNGEYWAMGLPVVISNNISDDSEIIETNNIGVVLRAFSQEEYQNAVLKIDNLRSQPGLRNKIIKIARQYRGFEIAEKVYKEVYAKGLEGNEAATE
jgi:glycosyltransferase involved in cell wall biosynthesis